MRLGAASRLVPFVKVARTIRGHRDGILAAVHLGISNSRLEGLDNRVRLITRRAFGFHSADAVAALAMLCCGPVNIDLPFEVTNQLPPTTAGEPEFATTSDGKPISG